MKAQQLFNLVLVLMVALSLVTTTWAQTHQTGEKRNLFKTAGKKQTNKDFKPAPDEIVKIN